MWQPLRCRDKLQRWRLCLPRDGRYVLSRDDELLSARKRPDELRGLRHRVPRLAVMCKRELSVPRSKPDSLRSGVREHGDEQRELRCMQQRMPSGADVHEQCLCVSRCDSVAVWRCVCQSSDGSQQLWGVWHRVSHGSELCCGDVPVSCRAGKLRWSLCEHRHEQHPLRRMQQRLQRHADVCEQRVYVRSGVKLLRPQLRQLHQRSCQLWRVRDGL